MLLFSLFRHRPLFHCAALASAMAFGGNAVARPPKSFDGGRPLLNPEQYFTGNTRSWGVFESRSGEPTQMLQTRTSGHRLGGVLHFEQELAFEHGKHQHRSWLLHRVDAHHYTATGTGIVGVARGEAYGNVFHLVFTLDYAPGNPLLHLQMSQWMYLQADGKTLINRDTLTKAGFIVAEITEQFRRE